MLQKAPSLMQARLDGIGHLIIEVGDIAAAEAFYSSFLGFQPVGRDFWPLPGGPATAALKAPSGQHLVLAKATPRNDLSVSPVHQAYTVSAETRDAIVAKLAADGVTVQRYREDRPAEADDNFYFTDPFGNRVQLVARAAGKGLPGVAAIDHTALETHNIHWAREFYGAWLRCRLDHRVGWKTEDYLNAKGLGEAGMAAAMPGARYWNERYSKFEKERKALRPNVQVYFDIGGGMCLAVYLASRKYQASRDDEISGTPRIALRTNREGLENLAIFLRERERVVEGPVEHGKAMPIAASIYVRDPGGNFLEFCAAR